MQHFIFEFIGGPNDGKTLCSDSSNPDEAASALRAGWAFSLGKAVAEREEQLERNFGTYLLPSPQIVERARTEGWSQDQIKAMMTYYEYTVTDFKRDGNLVMIAARYKGIA